jgi:hypothetical protein
LFEKHRFSTDCQAVQGEAVQPRKIVAEKTIECLFVIRKQLFYKAFIVQVDSHCSSIAFACLLDRARTDFRSRSRSQNRINTSMR